MADSGQQRHQRGGQDVSTGQAACRKHLTSTCWPVACHPQAMGIRGKSTDALPPVVVYWDQRLLVELSTAGVQQAGTGLEGALSQTRGERLSCTLPHCLVSCCVGAALPVCHTEPKQLT